MKKDNESTLRMKRIIKENLKTLYKEKGSTQKALGAACHVSQQTVSKWSADNNSMPTADYLPVIAEHFGVTVDWLLSDHNPDSVFAGMKYYTDAFVALKPLIDNGTIRTACIRDPILKYLEEEAFRIINSGRMDPDDVEEWISRVLKDFHGYRLPACLDPELWQAAQETGIKTSYPDAMKEYAALAQAVSTVHDETVELKKKHTFWKDLAETQSEDHNFHAYLADAVNTEESDG